MACVGVDGLVSPHAEPDGRHALARVSLSSDRSVHPFLGEVERLREVAPIGSHRGARAAEGAEEAKDAAAPMRQ